MQANTAQVQRQQGDFLKSTFSRHVARSKTTRTYARTTALNNCWTSSSVVWQSPGKREINGRQDGKYYSTSRKKNLPMPVSMNKRVTWIEMAGRTLVHRESWVVGRYNGAAHRISISGILQNLVGYTAYSCSCRLNGKRELVMRTAERGTHRCKLASPEICLYLYGSTDGYDERRAV